MTCIYLYLITKMSSSTAIHSFKWKISQFFNVVSDFGPQFASLCNILVYWALKTPYQYKRWSILVVSVISLSQISPVVPLNMVTVHRWFQKHYSRPSWAAPRPVCYHALDSPAERRLLRETWMEKSKHGTNHITEMCLQHTQRSGNTHPMCPSHRWTTNKGTSMLTNALAHKRSFVIVS